MNLETVFLLILTTARIVVPGIPSEYTGDDGKVYKSPLPAKFDLSMSLASSSSNKGKANVYLPEGVNSGEVVRMLQENLEPEAQTSDAIPEAAKIINYWGSGTAISDGQPLLGMTKGVTLELQALPKGSRAYWPDLSRRNPPEPKSAAGKYKLYTNYCGNAFFTIPPTQDFLPPVDLTDIPANPNLGKNGLSSLRRLTNMFKNQDEFNQIQLLDATADLIVTSGQAESMISLLAELERLVQIRLKRR